MLSGAARRVAIDRRVGRKGDRDGSADIDGADQFELAAMQFHDDPRRRQSQPGHGGVDLGAPTAPAFAQGLLSLPARQKLNSISVSPEPRKSTRLKSSGKSW